MKRLRISWVDASALMLFSVYALLFVASISEYWFNPLYTTDDARQQAFPLYRALFPNAFQDDPITESMLGYLSPLHYWISWVVTLFTNSPVMTGHVVMLFQLLGTLFFLYRLVEYLGGRVPALFSLVWYLHTRNLPMRMTCGLPRGWGGIVLVAFLYYLVRKKHSAVHVVLFLGILTNPPAVFLAAATYGLYLSIQFMRRETRYEFRRPAIIFYLCCPLYAALAYASLERPAKFGTMATLEEAEANPAFDRHGGRFAFVPLRSPWAEISDIGIQAFINRWHPVPNFVRVGVTALAFSSVVLLTFLEYLRKREYLPNELKYFFVATLVVYFLSRFFAFQLYVPDRHLQFPLNTFWIVGFSVAAWRLFQRDGSDSLARPISALVVLGILLFLLGGDGLRGSANFNTRTDERVNLYTWLRLNTDRNDIVASHPSVIDGIQLFAMRPAYITTETAHPFYSGYWKLCRERITRSLRLYYATSLEEFLATIGEEPIRYFVFLRSSFRPESLAKAHYYKPHNELARRLALRARSMNLSTLLETLESMKRAKVFDDGEQVVLDIAKLRKEVSE